MTDQLSKVFAALADPTRRDMVSRLCEADATVGELAAPYDVSMQAVSKHLKVLEGAGLVTRGRDAQRRPVHLEAEVFDLMTKWIERYRQQAEERYQRLDAVLAAMNDDTDHHHRGRISMSTTNTADGTTTIEADPTVPLIRMTREFRATPAQLVKAHTDPDLFVQWVGPNGIETGDRPLGRPHGRELALHQHPPRARSTASTAASTRWATSVWCRPSPSRAPRTASPWRRCPSRTWARAGPGCTSTSLVDSFEGRDGMAVERDGHRRERRLRQARRPSRGRRCLSAPHSATPTNGGQAS